MSKEIERKFLVADDEYVRLATEKHEILQGYLSVNPKSVIRVRIKDEKAYLTVKSKTVGFTRDEYEYEIPASDAFQMLKLCSWVLQKTRYIVPFAGYIWEVDEFKGKLEGLKLAEIELENEDSRFDIPSFIGQEVTGNPKYYNSNLHNYTF